MTKNSLHPITWGQKVASDWSFVYDWRARAKYKIAKWSFISGSTAN